MGKRGTPPKDIGIHDALRAAGYVRIPRWWVTRDELEVIYRMAHNHEEDVTRIRRTMRLRAGLED